MTQGLLISPELPTKRSKLTSLYMYMGKILKSQFIENYWRLMYHIWHRYFINQKHGNISTWRLMDDPWPLFQGHMNTCFRWLILFLINRTPTFEEACIPYIYKYSGEIWLKFQPNFSWIFVNVWDTCFFKCWCSVDQKWLPCPYLMKTGKWSVTCKRMCTEYWLTT